ncbi:hypothetical protein N8H69_13090 [Achromobacter spanius]|uniref:hypothetical protein n=1 Tax=Achromobacter TaxID=222 RepID=UPI001E53ADA0|nr:MULTISPECIES: hypothetical protein [Achromobacter]MCD0497162.1 hypothetical protein [Achromobacter sp. MY14]MCW3153471.1 hypothetical protein [Achromobacter spanius]
MPTRTVPAPTSAALLVVACLLPLGAMAATPASPSNTSVDVCTVAGTSGQYSVRVRNTGAAPLARVDITGVHLNASGQATEPVNVSLSDIPPGKYKTAILARRGESAALDRIVTYTLADGKQIPQQELFAGKVAHVSPGSALQYTLAPLAVRGWTVAYGSPNAARLAAGSAVILSYPVRSGKQPATRPEAGRTPTAVTPLEPCE